MRKWFTWLLCTRWVDNQEHRSCGKVMFLHLSVSHSVHRGVSLTETPLIETPRDRNPSGQRPHLNWDPLDRDPALDRDPLYGKERAVRILLECILVFRNVYIFSTVSHFSVFLQDVLDQANVVAIKLQNLELTDQEYAMVSAACVIRPSMCTLSFANKNGCFFRRFK